jgi:hypothetical protein
MYCIEYSVCLGLIMADSEEKPPWSSHEDEYALGLLHGLLVGIVVGVLMTLAVESVMGVI